MKIGYVRVSMFHQNIERQEVIMEQLGVERVFIDKMSGKNKERPQLQEMLGFVREGDELIVESISRLGRNTRDLLEIVDKLTKKNVKFVSQKENIDTNTTTGRFMLILFGAIAEMERECLLERQREGIAIAKAQGKFKGRRPRVIDLHKWKLFYGFWKDGKIKGVHFRTEMGMSHNMFYRKVRQWEQDAKINKACELPF